MIGITPICLYFLVELEREKYFFSNFFICNRDFLEERLLEKTSNEANTLMGNQKFDIYH
jgi:hypothetical protein